MDWSSYAGRWVAVIGEQVVGVGTSAEAAQQMAQRSRGKETAVVRYIDVVDPNPLRFLALLADLRPFFQEQTQPVYLVGGAVRDAILGRVSHDLDFIVAEKAIRLAFKVGDHLGLPAYVLDQERDTARVMVADQQTMLDFARLRGDDLAADLGDRDFTINALAIPATADSHAAIIDLFGGLDDLAAGLIRQIRPDSLATDPARVLRAVRQAHKLGFTIEPVTAASVTQFAPGLVRVSAERINDELVKLLNTPTYPQGVADLVHLRVADVVLPEIAALSGVAQSPPHHEDVGDHTLSTLRWLQRVERAVAGLAPLDAIDEALAVCLERFSAELQMHLAREVDGGVDGAVLLRLSALFHDVGKPDTQTEEDGKIRFYGHDLVGAELAEQRMRTLTFSNAAVRHVVRTVENHMRPLMLANAGHLPPSRRAIFRFFRATKVAGIDVALLSLADSLATYDGMGSAEVWHAISTVVAELLEAYFSQHETQVAPEPLLNGNELMQELGLVPGRQIGELLAAVLEAQAAGELGSREEALALARQLVQSDV